MLGRDTSQFKSPPLVPNSFLHTNPNLPHLKPVTKPPLPSCPNPVKQTTPLPTRRLSPEEMQTRRNQGLCFRCPERFYPGHRCNPPQFLLLGHDEPIPLTSDTGALTNLEDYSGGIQPHQFLALSAAALHGTTCPLAIRITGQINGHTVTVLVDSGHDIIKPCLVSLLHFTFDFPTSSHFRYDGYGSFSIARDNAPYITSPF
ncbi:hypothetical protein Tco_0837994 [Tanacetum coccineum]